jgi:hypothetical protein
MAKKKDELRADRNRHVGLMRKVRAAHCDGRFQEAVELAVKALNNVDGMMQYESRFGDRSEYSSVDSIDYILRYAPLLFDLNSLERVAVVLKSQRRIDKNTTTDLATRLEVAESQMWEAHRLWDDLEEHGEVRQDELRQRLGGDQDEWRRMAETWEQMGVVQRTPDGGSYRVTITTCLGDTIRGKCPSCGVTGKATRERFLEEIKCPKCQATVHFVFVP